MPPVHLKEGNETTVVDEEGRIKPEDREPTTSEDSGATILRGIFCKFVHLNFIM